MFNKTGRLCPWLGVSSGPGRLVFSSSTDNKNASMAMVQRMTGSRRGVETADALEEATALELTGPRGLPRPQGGATRKIHMYVYIQKKTANIDMDKQIFWATIFKNGAGTQTIK